MNEVRVLKTFFKIAIDFEGLFSRFERECLKLIVDMVSTTDELLVLSLFCYGEVLRRSRRLRVLYGW